MDEMTLTLNNPLTEEEWDLIEDVDFDKTNSIEFHTKHGKTVKFVKSTDERTGDLINRQAAVDAVKSYLKAEVDAIPKDADFFIVTATCDMILKLNEELCRVLDQLPSVHPEVIAHGEGELTAQPDLKGARCEIICSQRQTGRTTKLIEKCARYKYALIVCPSRMRANNIFHYARKMGKNIPMPMTFGDFLQGRFAAEHINAFLIDDLDSCLEIYSHNVPIDTVVFEGRAEE